MKLFKTRTKPAAAVPVDPEPVVESPTEPENVQVSVILDAESITALIQQISDFYQRTKEKLNAWDQYFLKNITTSVSPAELYKKDAISLQSFHAKNEYAWKIGKKLEDYAWIHKDEESFEIKL